MAVITTSFPGDTPGSEAAGSFVYDFAVELSKKIKLSVIAPGRQSGTEKQATFDIKRFAVPCLPLSNLSVIKPQNWLAIYRTIRAGMRAIDEFQRLHRCDYIFALWAIPSGYWARKIMQKYGVHYAIWALGSDIWKFRNKPVLHGLLNKILFDADQCFADGYTLKDDVEKIANRSCRFLPSARCIQVSDRKDKHSRPPYRLAYLGRWHTNKGIDLLLESLDQLEKDDWNSIEEIRIGGGGPFESRVNQYMDKFNLETKPVVKLGYLSKNSAVDLLQWADYLLIPSRIESIPVIFSDAMQCGTPVIAMPVGDLPELVAGNHVGVVADAVTASAFSGAIRKALHIPPVTFKNDIGNIAGRFNMGHIVDQFLSCVNSV
jgi:glycosyltransferase involved in cell wall biosynthesis